MFGSNTILPGILPSGSLCVPKQQKSHTKPCTASCTYNYAVAYNMAHRYTLHTHMTLQLTKVAVISSFCLGSQHGHFTLVRPGDR